MSQKKNDVNVAPYDVKSDQQGVNIQQLLGNILYNHGIPSKCTICGSLDIVSIGGTKEGGFEVLCQPCYDVETEGCAEAMVEAIREHNERRFKRYGT